MQIHELNNFSGTLGSGSYLAIDDGNDTGKISKTQLFAATEARIDNIIAGPAPSAEEIVDARLGDDGVTYPSLGDAIRDQFSDVKSALNDIEENTDNLWTFGDTGSFVRNKNYASYALAKGEYTIGALVTSTDADSTTTSMVFTYSDSTTEFVNFNRNKWMLRQVTLSKNVVSVQFYASNNWSHSSGDTASWSNILILKGAYSEVPTYIPYKTAVDYEIRDRFGSEKSSCIIASGFYRDNIMEHNGRYILMKSEDGVNFSILNIALPSNVVAYDASAIIEYGGYFIFAEKGPINSAYTIQFFATKDFKTWVESHVPFPDDFQGKANSAIAFYVDNGNLYISWSAEYQNISDVWYQLPHYMKLSFSDGVISSDGTYNDIAIGNSANNDSYIDPFVLIAENAYYVAIKNEITKRIELYKGESLSSLTMIMNPKGTLVEAPSIVFNDKTRTMTLYGSGHSLGTVINDALLYVSFRLLGSSSETHNYGETIWNLAEYRSLYRIRHPYCLIASQATQNYLDGYSTVPAPNYPENLTIECEQRNDGAFYLSGDYVLEQFVAHPRVRYIITSATTSDFNTDMKLIPLANQPCQIVVKPNSYNIGFDFDGSEWGDYENKHFSASNINVPFKVNFEQIDDGVWCADYAVVDNFIS